MYIAHIRESDGKEQTLSSHCRNVAALCSRGAEIVGLSKLARQSFSASFTSRRAFSL